MTRYEQEVLNRFGKAVLDAIRADFGSNFFIIGSDDDRCIVGDKEKNFAYSRKKARVTDRFFHGASRSMKRKGQI